MTMMPVTIQERIPMPPMGAGSRGAAAAGGLSAGDVIRILKQRIFLILTVWFLLATAGAAATLVLNAKYPLFTAQGAVVVESPHPRAPMNLTETQVSAETMNRYVQDQRVLIKDEEILTSALEDTQIMATDWYRTQPDKNLILGNLKDKLSVTQVPQTSYLMVSFTTRVPKDASTIVNTVIDKYIYKLQTMSQSKYEGELQGYRNQEKALNSRLQEILDGKQRFVAEKLGTPGVTEGLNVVGETLRSYAAAVARAEEEKFQYKAIYDNLSNVDATRIAISPQMQLMIQQDPQISALQQQRFSLAQQRTELMQTVGPNHRSVVTLDTRLAALDKTLNEMTAQKEKDIREYQVNSANTEYLNAAQRELALREKKLSLEAQQRDLDRDLAEYQRLDEDRQLVINELNQIRDYIGRLQLVIKDQDMVRVHRVGQALQPLQPSFPKVGLMIPAAGMFGLLVAVGLAVLLELIDTSLKTARDVARHVHVPILGTVPDLDDEEVPIEVIEMAAQTAPRSMVAEAFRSIRTNLLLSAPAERQRTLMVTSAKPEEGKTTIAVNLAISLGQSGRRVLLVDANFHRPALHQLFGKSQREGLSSALIGRARVEELAQPTDLPNLDLITSGPIPPNPAELLASNYFREFIAQASERYDQIIFDCPPVLLVSDALVLATTLDGAVLVCRAKGTSRGVVQRARDQLERVKGRLFGAVLNAARVRRGGYFREQIRSYYDYQSQEALASDAPSKALPEESETTT